MYQPNNVGLVQNKQKTGTEYLLKKKIKDTSKPLIYDNIITDGHWDLMLLGEMNIIFKR